MPDLDAYALLAAVSDVVLLVDPVRPERVTQVQFDTAAGRDARFAQLPRAQQLTRILKQGWKDLVELSLRPQASRERSLVMRQRADNAGCLEHGQGEYALRLASLRLGGVASFGPKEYRLEREAILREVGADTASGFSEPHLLLPSEDQLLTLFGDWDSALVAAGLRPRDGVVNTVQGRPPKIVDVLDRCFEAHGTEPRMKELALFAQANGIPFPRKERGRPFSDFVREWKERRTAAGLPVPAGVPPKRDRPDYSRDVGAREEGEARAKSWELDECVTWLRRYLDDLTLGARPSTRGYDKWAESVDGAPWLSSLTRYDRFTDLMRLARSAAS